MYVIVLIIKPVDWNRFANQLIDTSKNLHHLYVSDQVMCFYIATKPKGEGPVEMPRINNNFTFVILITL